MNNEKYGNRNVAKMYKQINELRALILSEGTDSIQEAWSKVEEHIDYAYAKQRKEDAPDLLHAMMLDSSNESLQEQVDCMVADMWVEGQPNLAAYYRDKLRAMLDE